METCMYRIPELMRHFRLNTCTEKASFHLSERSVSSMDDSSLLHMFTSDSAWFHSMLPHLNNVLLSSCRKIVVCVHTCTCAHAYPHSLKLKFFLNSRGLHYCVTCSLILNFASLGRLFSFTVNNDFFCSSQNRVHLCKGQACCNSWDRPLPYGSGG